MQTVSALWIDPVGAYSRIPGLDLWDRERDAKKWPGGNPCICHPPCGHWGNYFYRCFDSGADASYAVKFVRENGGCLEQPAHSKLFREFGLPWPGEFFDEAGGYSIEIPLSGFGYPALKPTWLYFVGVERDLVMERFKYCGSPDVVPFERVKKSIRHLTPIRLAWLIVETVKTARRVIRAIQTENL